MICTRLRISCQNALWRHYRQRTQSCPGFHRLCSLEPKAARDLRFRVTDRCDAGVMVFQETVKCSDAAVPVRMGQVLRTVTQKESGIQVSLDPVSINDGMASGEFFLCIGVGSVVILAGAERPCVHFQVPAAQGGDLPLQDAAELRRRPALQASAEPFPPAVFFRFPLPLMFLLSSEEL